MGASSAPFRSVVAPALESTGAEGRCELSSAERRGLIIATAAIAAEQHQRAIDVLQRHVTNAQKDVHPRIFERLAGAYLAMDRADEAIGAAKQGLASSASDPGLNLMLINALASKADWTSVLTRWEALPETVRTGADVWTHISMARAFRKTGDHANAEQLARKAALRWPQNAFFEHEIYRCRPYLVDWRRCWTSNNDDTGTSSAGGAVESLGFLTGGSLPLTGWLNTSEEGDTKVSLTVNGVEVASTNGAPAVEKPSGKSFSINCADLLQFVGDGDVVEVVSESENLVLPGYGQSAVLACDHASRMNELAEKLKAGFVFTKDGVLRPGLTLARKKALLDFFGTVCEVIASKSGQPVYPFYGNLLGAIRQNDFIDHDVGGFDMLYLCSACEPAAIRSEVISLCAQLAGAGFHLTAKPHSVLIRSDRNREQLLDMSYGWFNPSDELNVSFGWRFKPARNRDQFMESRHCRLADRDVLVPGNAEEVLTQIYGPSWQIPDQGFSVGDGLEQADACLLSDEDIRTIENFAASRD